MLGKVAASPQAHDISDELLKAQRQLSDALKHIQDQDHGQQSNIIAEEAVSDRQVASELHNKRGSIDSFSSPYLAQA